MVYCLDRKSAVGSCHGIRCDSREGDSREGEPTFPFAMLLHFFCFHSCYYLTRFLQPIPQGLPTAVLSPDTTIIDKGASLLGQVDAMDVAFHKNKDKICKSKTCDKKLGQVIAAVRTGSAEENAEKIVARNERKQHKN